MPIESYSLFCLISNQNPTIMKQTRSSDELPYQEAHFDGIEKHILAAKGISANSKIGRRPFMDLLATVGGGLSLSALLSSCGSSEDSGELDEPVKIGYIPITDSVPLILAHAKGYFEEEGLKTEKPTLIRGWSPLVEAFIANKLNMAHFLIPIPLWMRYNNDVKVKVMSWAHTNGSAIIVGGHTEAKDFKDLGGSQIAVPYWYSMHNIVLQMGLVGAGLKPVIKDQKAELAADEVNLMVMPPPEMPASLAAKKIDAYIVAEPFNAMGELKAGGRVMRFTGDIWKNHPCCVVCLHEEQTVKKPIWTQKVMNAVVRANVYASKNKEEVAELLSKDGMGYLPMPAAVIKRAMTHYGTEEYMASGACRNTADWKNGRIDFQPWPYPSATKFMVDWMNKTVVGGDNSFLDGLDREMVASDLVDYDFVKKSCEKYPEWKDDPSVNRTDPYEREEVLSI